MIFFPVPYHKVAFPTESLLQQTHVHDTSLINPDVMVFLRNFQECFLLLVACFPYMQSPVHSTRDLRLCFLFRP